MTTQQERGAAFRALHEGEPFVIPNPWDAGSAKVFAGMGFKALATTSSGFAFTLGLDDGGPDARPGDRARSGARGGDGPAALGRPGERPRARANRRRDGYCARGRGRRGRGLDRGFRSRAGPLRARPGGRTRRGGGRGRKRGGLRVHAHGPGREPHPRQPGPRRHDRPAAGLRGRRRGRALRPRPAHGRGDPRDQRGDLAAAQRARQAQAHDVRDRRRGRAARQPRGQPGAGWPPRG